MTYLSSPADAFAQSLVDMVEADRRLRQSIRDRAEWDGLVAYLVTVSRSLRELAPDHAVLRSDVQETYVRQARQLSLADNVRRPTFDAWSFHKHPTFRSPHQVAAELDREAQARREILIRDLLAGIQVRRRRRWYCLWLFGPKGVAFLGNWWPEERADDVRVWRDHLVAHLRNQWGKPCPCPSLHELVRACPGPRART